MRTLPLATDTNKSRPDWDLADIDDLRRDVLLDRLASIQPECLADLLDYADRLIEVVR